MSERERRNSREPREPVSRIEHVSKTFGGGRIGHSVKALDDVAVAVDPGEAVVVLGPSGSGKSTLLRVVNALERVDHGRIVVDGVEVTARRTTAAAAAYCGLDCMIIHNDEPSAEPTGNLLLNRLYGADIRFVCAMDEEARGRVVLAVRDALAAEGRRPYVVGDPAIRALGYVAGALELNEQDFAVEPDLRHVVLPGSMGVTEAGFLYGCALIGKPFQVHLVTVEYPVAELRRCVETIFDQVTRLTATRPAGVPADFTRYHDSYLGPGYDQPTAEALEAMQIFATRDALLLEITYTSKTFAGSLDLIGNGVLPRDEPVCILHTGGVPALFQQAHRGGT